MIRVDVKREIYLKRIRPFYDSDLIKVITGVRRSGKSTILRQIKEEIMDKGVTGKQIIEMNFELLEYAHIRNEMDLYDHIKRSVPDGMCYMFFDEIQNVDGFERAINSFKAEFQCSIFVTGSNGKLLSGELATVLTGRYVSFRVMPFTFREVAEYRKMNSEPCDADALLNEYIRLGGMPQRLSMDERSARTYLRDLKASIVGKDILMRSKVTNVDLLTRILDFMLSNSSNVFTANSVKNFLKSEGRSVSAETVYNYVDDILASLMISKAKRFDIKGKEVMRMHEKYYAADTGLWFSDRSFNDTDVGASIETIVYNELIARGYDVHIGKIGDMEVDFVVERDGKRGYMQATYLMADESTRDREFRSLEAIGDNYPKYVVSMDGLDVSRNGIIHINMMDFLMSDDTIIK